MAKPQKSVIITGGNSGLGYQCARALATTRDWQIIIASRDPQRTQAAVDELIAETGYPHIQARSLDLASFASVRRFATDFKQASLPPLQALVCNAGMTSTSFELHTTEDGIETIFSVNHLGHFLLVNLLSDVLVESARVVFVSSGTHLPEHRMARMMGVPKPCYTSARELALPLQASAERRVTNPSQRYSTSKLCNVLCAYELSRRVESSGVGVFVLDPGLMPGTGFLRELPAAVRWVASRLITLLHPLIDQIRMPEQAGRDLARLVTDPALNGKTALYFDAQREARSSAESYDLVKAQDLWDTSVELTQLTPEESRLIQTPMLVR